MTPKEKAIELVNKFPFNGFLLKYGDAPKQYKEHSKQCALITCDEIIKAIDFDWMEVQNLENEHRYWQSVKNEIEKL